VLQNIVGKTFGEFLFGASELLLHLLVGWPAYILFGATGGYSRGITNHFIPIQFKRPIELFPDINKKPLKNLFPNKSKVFLSDIGVVAMLGVLFAAAKTFGTYKVLAMYGGPLLVVNAWLVAYTWLQHTEVDVPHLPAENFTFVKGDDDALIYLFIYLF
jgi:omega-6 fatty acid desaturase (delta-12 desaturase)